jgi:hypothetical protein
MNLRRFLHRTWLRIASHGRKPTFLIIGAARCGTTSLFHYLAGHPQVAVPRTKEIHFFDFQYEKGIDWYMKCLASTKTQTGSRGTPTVCGEASPYYIFHPHAIQRIRMDLPEVKLIALLRNPVDRAYSHYWHMMRLGHESLSFEEAVAREPERLAGELERTAADASYHSYALVRHSYVMRGIYADQFARVLRHFPRSQVKILRSENLYADPQRAFDEVADFLGIERCAIAGPQNMTAVTEGTGAWVPPPMGRGVRRQLAEFFRPHNQRLYELLGRDFAWGRE